MTNAFALVPVASLEQSAAVVALADAVADLCPARTPARTRTPAARPYQPVYTVYAANWVELARTFTREWATVLADGYTRRTGRPATITGDTGHRVNPVPLARGRALRNRIADLTGNPSNPHSYPNLPVVLTWEEA